MSNQPDPYDTPAQEKIQLDRQDQEIQNARQEADDLRWLLSDKRGRRIMWRLLSIAGINRNPFTGNSETFFRCGEMNVGQRFMADINDYCPERYIEMIKERTDHDNRTKPSRRKNT